MQAHDATPLNDYIEYPVEEMLSRSENFYLDIKRRHTIRSFSDREVPKERTLLLQRTLCETDGVPQGSAPDDAPHTLLAWRRAKQKKEMIFLRWKLKIKKIKN